MSPRVIGLNPSQTITVCRKVAFYKVRLFIASPEYFSLSILCRINFPPIFVRYLPKSDCRNFF